jgi:hypothetical protein
MAPKDGIIIQSSNGIIGEVGGATVDPSTGQSAVGNAERLKWRQDYAGTLVVGNNYISYPDGALWIPESQGGYIANYFGATQVHGQDVNIYTMPTQQGAWMLVPKFTQNVDTVPVAQSTLLYNVSPILLRAENRGYKTGIAEVFWETLIIWKDDSNHDYYGKYIHNTKTRSEERYILPGQFVRIPELLGNYGQEMRDDAFHTEDRANELFARTGGDDTYYSWFYDERGEESPALGGDQAMAAQIEQYWRGFGYNEYNYDRTNTTTVAGKKHSDLYNESHDLTGVAKGREYMSSGTPSGNPVGWPYIFDGVFTESYQASSANRHVGSLNGIPQSGYIQRAAYTRAEGDGGVYRLNDVIIYTPITARPVSIMPVAEWRDQRIDGQSMVALQRA